MRDASNQQPTDGPERAVEVVPLGERPDLVPLLARWLWAEFGHLDNMSLAETQADLAAAILARDMPRVFVLLEAGEPVGTASLLAQDLPERPDLTPWLASVFITPEARGRGLVHHLIRSVEAEASRQGHRRLWLYTWRSRTVYARAGWRVADHVTREGLVFDIMDRDLTPGG